jgi:hypothetical protein
MELNPMVTETNISRLSQFVLQNKLGMIREQDLQNLYPSAEEFVQTIPELVKNFRAIGLSLIRTTFKGEKYFVLTSPGKDPSISPNMYGTLALILTMFQEIGVTATGMPLGQMRKLFQEVWGDVEQLISANYLQLDSAQKEEYLFITPIGKAAFKNIAKNLKFKELIDFS